MEKKQDMKIRKHVNHEPAPYDSQSSSMYEETTTCTRYSIYLPDSLDDDMSLHTELLNALDLLEEKDSVSMYISCTGGALSTTQNIAYGMKSCKGTVNVKVIGNSYSGGAMLALCGDSLELLPGTFLMFHNSTGGIYGKGGESLLQANEENRGMKNVLDHICSPFLTKKELAGLAKDQDVYIHSDDKTLKTRIARHFVADTEAAPNLLDMFVST